MSIIDKQRVSAVATLEQLGYTFSLADGWSAAADAASAPTLLPTAEPDAMHAVLVLRAPVGVVSQFFYRGTGRQRFRPLSEALAKDSAWWTHSHS